MDGTGAVGVMETAPSWTWGDVDARDETGMTRLTHSAARAELWCDGGRLRRGSGYAAASRPARHALARTGAILCLRARGRFLLHASGVVDPGGRAWLLAGDSGCGKSTLAYALAREGWRVLGDDGVLVEVAGSGVIAHSWRDALHVSAELAAFPELAGRSGSAPPGDARRRIAVHVDVARRAPLAAILLPARAAGDARRVTHTTALAALVRHSPWVVLGDVHAAAHLAALTVMARQIPAFVLPHDESDLGTLAGRLGALA